MKAADLRVGNLYRIDTAKDPKWAQTKGGQILNGATIRCIRITLDPRGAYFTVESEPRQTAYARFALARGFRNWSGEVRFNEGHGLRCVFPLDRIPDAAAAIRKAFRTGLRNRKKEKHERTSV